MYQAIFMAMNGRGIMLMKHVSKSWGMDPPRTVPHPPLLSSWELSHMFVDLTGRSPSWDLGFFSKEKRGEIITFPIYHLDDIRMEKCTILSFNWVGGFKHFLIFTPIPGEMIPI